MPRLRPSPAAIREMADGRAQAERGLRAHLHRPAHRLLAHDLGRLRPATGRSTRTSSTRWRSSAPRSRSSRPWARWTPTAAQQARRPDRPGRAGERRAARDEIEKAEERARQARRRVVPRRPGLPVHQGRDRRRPLRVRGGRPQEHAAAPPTRRSTARRAGEALERAAQLELEDVDARRDGRGREASHELEKTQLDAEKTQKELYAETTGCEERLAQDPARLRVLRAQPARARPGQPVAEGQPDHARQPPGRRDLHAARPRWTAARPATWASTRRATRTRPSPTRTHPNLELYLQGPHPIDAVGCTVVPPGPRPRHQLRERRAHAVHARSRRRPGASTPAASTYHGLHYWDLPMMAKGHTEAQCVKCHQGVVEVPQGRQPQHRAASSSSATAATAATRSRAGRTCARSAPT